MTLAAAVLWLAAVAGAQTHRVAKPEKVTRAVAVYEWTGDLAKPTASRLVPVSLFIEGHLEDAGVYLARPVPFALNPGYIYSVEKAGEPVGTLDLDSARNLVTRRADDDDNPIAAWFGYGRYTPPPAVARAPALRTTAHPAAIVASSADGRPHLSTRTADADTAGSSPDKGKASAPAQPGKPAPARPADSASPSGSPASGSDDADRPHMNRRTDDSSGSTAPADSGSTTSTNTSSTDDPDRPRMSRRSDSSSSPDAPASPATGSTGTDTADDDAERPTLRRRGNKADTKRKKESGSGVTPMATSLNDDPDRPTLSHGSSSVAAGTPPLVGNPPDLRQAVAISDPTTVDNHPFERAWESPAERSAVLASFQALARPRVANYLTLNELKPGSAIVSASPAPGTAAPRAAAPSAPAQAPTPTEDTGAPPKLQRGRPKDLPGPAVPSAAPAPAVKPAAPSAKVAATSARGPKVLARGAARGKPAAPGPLLLQDEQLTGFTLSYGGLPTFVYSARTPVQNGLPVRITLVAQQLASGELQVALNSVTDEAHLDRSPWMRLVDVVDPNDSHRASFLFELRAKSSRQFALYSLVSSRAEQTFVTGLIQ